MKATNSARACSYCAVETVRPSKSGNAKAGRSVPSGSMVEGVATTVAFDLAQCEGEFDRDEDGNRFAETRAGLETPLLGGLDRFLIETECRVERAHHFDRPDRAVGQHDAFEQHGPLHLGTHGVGRVLRLDLSQGHWQVDTVTGSIGTTADAATESWTQSGSLAWPGTR